MAQLIVKNFGNLLFVYKAPFLSCPRKRESSKFREFWTPASAGVTVVWTFCEIIKFNHYLFYNWLCAMLHAPCVILFHQAAFLSSFRFGMVAKTGSFKSSSNSDTVRKD
jgi:hypothetical protein